MDKKQVYWVPKYRLDHPGLRNIVPMILQYISGMDLISFARTCRKFYQLVRDIYQQYIPIFYEKITGDKTAITALLELDTPVLLFYNPQLIPRYGSFIDIMPSPESYCADKAKLRAVIKTIVRIYPDDSKFFRYLQLLEKIVDNWSIWLSDDMIKKCCKICGITLMYYLVLFEYCTEFWKVFEYFVTYRTIISSSELTMLFNIAAPEWKYNFARRIIFLYEEEISGATTFLDMIREYIRQHESLLI